MQKRSGERHGEQSGWYHASGPTVLAGKAQGREPLKGCAGLCRLCKVEPEERRAVLRCVFLLVTTARLLKISGVVNALLCFIVAEWRRPEEGSGEENKEDVMQDWPLSQTATIFMPCSCACLQRSSLLGLLVGMQ